MTFQGHLCVVARLAGPAAVGIHDPRKLVALGARHLELAVPADTGLRTLKRRLLRSLLKASLSHHLLLELHSLHSIPLAGGLGRGGHSSNSSLRLSSLGLGLLQRLNLQSLLCTCHALHSKRKAAGTTKDPA